MGVVVLLSVEVAVKGVETSVNWSVHFAAEAQMPSFEQHRYLILES